MMRPEEIDKIEAETERTLQEARKLNSDALLTRFGFCFRWLIIWLTVGGLIKLELIEVVAKWING